VAIATNDIETTKIDNKKIKEFAIPMLPSNSINETLEFAKPLNIYSLLSELEK